MDKDSKMENEVSQILSMLKKMNEKIDKLDKGSKDTGVLKKQVKLLSDRIDKVERTTSDLNKRVEFLERPNIKKASSFVFDEKLMPSSYRNGGQTSSVAVPSSKTAQPLLSRSITKAAASTSRHGSTRNIEDVSWDEIMDGMYPPGSEIVENMTYGEIMEEMYPKSENTQLEYYYDSDRDDGPHGVHDVCDYDSDTGICEY